MKEVADISWCIKQYMRKSQKAGSVRELDTFERMVDDKPDERGCGRGWEWDRVRRIIS